MLEILLHLFQRLVALDLGDVQENDRRIQFEIDLVEIVHLAAFDLIGTRGIVRGAKMLQIAAVEFGFLSAAVHDERGHALANLNNHVADIVGLQAGFLGVQLRRHLDEFLIEPALAFAVFGQVAGSDRRRRFLLGEDERELLGHAVLGRNALDRPRAGEGFLAVHLDVQEGLLVAGTVIANGDAELGFDALGDDARLGVQIGDGQVVVMQGHLPRRSPVRVGRVDQAQVNAGIDQLIDRLAQLLGAGSAPIQIAEIADEVQDFLPLRHIVEERLSLLDGLDGIDVHGRRLEVAQLGHRWHRKSGR